MSIKDHLGNTYNVEGNMENGLANTYDGHDIIDHVEGKSTHIHDTWLICGVVRDDVMAMKGDIVSVMGVMVTIRNDVVVVAMMP